MRISLMMNVGRLERCCYHVSELAFARSKHTSKLRDRDTDRRVQGVDLAQRRVVRDCRPEAPFSFL